MGQSAPRAEDSEFDAMADACIDAGERVMQSGSPALQTAMRLTLTILGREIAQRALDPRTVPGDDVDSAN